jgi:3-oxoacyl-[acyl-carrier protein] reductase
MVTYSVSRAIVTGAAQGIGREIAARLVFEGLNVAILDRDERAAKETAAAIATTSDRSVLGFGVDVSDPDAMVAAVAAVAGEFGGLDTVVANAGITRDRMFHRLAREDWNDVIAVNLTGTFNTLQAAAPWLRTDGPGRAVLISSMVAKTGNVGQMNYVAAKAGVVGLVRSGALELARFATTVNGVRPGFVRTPMTDAMPQDSRRQMIESIPLARPGEAAEVAAAVAFLVSDEAAFITGQVLDVNGGAAL